MGRLAILAGSGVLPGLIRAEEPDALTVHVQGVEIEPPSGEVLEARFEKLGALFKGMRAAGVDRVVFAGALGRPALNPMKFDAKLLSVAPRILPVLSGGDDALLRAVVRVFEAERFAVVGAHEAAPGLLAPAGVLAGRAPDADAQADIARAGEILAALAPLDLGQGAVVAGGLCLGIETLQGTDALLKFVGETPQRLRRGKGVLVKAPKQGQDLRVDMPAIGPQTVRNAAAAGLQGIAVAAGKTLILGRSETVAAAEAAGVFLIAK